MVKIIFHYRHFVVFPMDSGNFIFGVEAVVIMFTLVSGNLRPILIQSISCFIASFVQMKQELIANEKVIKLFFNLCKFASKDFTTLEPRGPSEYFVRLPQ